MISLSAPIDVSIELTSKCNLHCVHCFQPDDRAGHPLSTQEILDIGYQLADTGVFTVFLSGGEPLLNPDWARIGKEFLVRGLAVGLSTNGCLITREAANTIKTFGLYKALQVSLDGATSEIHDRIRGLGSFDKTIRALDHLAVVSIFPNIAVTVMKSNIDDVPNIIELAVQRKLNHVHVMSLMPAGRAKARFDNLDPTLEEWVTMETILQTKAETLKGMITVDWGNRRYLPRNPRLSEAQYTKVDRTFTGCPAGKSKAVVDCFGNVYGCDLLKNPEFCAGNIREQKFSDIWENSPIFKKWRGRMPDTIRGKCKGCKWLFACVGGCPALSVSEGYDIFESDPSCPSPV